MCKMYRIRLFSTIQTKKRSENEREKNQQKYKSGMEKIKTAQLLKRSRLSMQ